jgi:MOB kinase activator 1
MLFATLVDFCTEESCPSMSAGPKYKYFWSDGSSRKPEDVPACKYVFSLMEWIQAQLEDDAVFPARLAGPFPKVLESCFSKLFDFFGVP